MTMTDKLYITVLLCGTGLFMIICAVIGLTLAHPQSDELNKADFLACEQVGGTYEQCEKIVYPERWEKKHLRHEQMRNKLKSY